MSGSGLRSSARSRAITLPFSTAAGLLATSLILGIANPKQFGVVAVISGLPMLLPFADLGIGAAVSTEMARGQEGNPLETLRRALFWTTISGAILASLSILGSWIGCWSTLLGVPGERDVDIAVAWVGVLFGATVPLALGYRVLTGSGMNSRAIQITALGPLASLLAILILRVLHAPVPMYAIYAQLGTFIAAGIGLHLALKQMQVSGQTIWNSPPQKRSFPNESLWKVARPMIIINIALPIALQSDRLILAQRSSLMEVGHYAIMAQMYTPLWASVSTVGAALWPIFIVSRLNSPGRTHSIWRARTIQLTLAAIGLSAILAFAGIFIVPIISHQQISPSFSLIALFACLLVVQSAHLGSGMFLTRPTELRFQVACVSLMLVSNLTISWWLSPKLGAIAPVLASVLSIGFLQLLPCYYYASRCARRMEVMN